MGNERLDAEIKTRVPEGIKSELETIATDRHLDTADIVREALRDFLAKNKPKEGKAKKEKQAA